MSEIETFGGEPLDPHAASYVIVVKDAEIARLREIAEMVDAWGNGLRHRTAHESKMVDAARAALNGSPAPELSASMMVHHSPDLAAAMRRQTLDECEAIVRSDLTGDPRDECDRALSKIADAIAALKRKGERDAK